MDIKNVKLHNLVEFDKRFEEYYKNAKTYTEAYEKVEEDYKDTFGVRRYVNFISFKNAYNRRNST